MLNLTHRQKHSAVPSRHHKVFREIMFACLRSMVAYERPNKMQEYFKSRQLSKYYKLDKCDDLMDVRSDPIFYNGRLIRKDRQDAQGYMILNDSNLYVTFRGSNDWQDLLKCADIRQVHFADGVRIHKGYYDQFYSIEREITQDIMKLTCLYEIDKLVFAGHSAGASMAMIAAPYYASLLKHKKEVACYSFGTTAVGNEQYVKWFMDNVKEHFRVEIE